VRAGPPDTCDVAVVGAGIVGLAVARELLARRPGERVVVLDRAPHVGSGQTDANSGVIHAGIYYAPGSLKARLCVEGARELYTYCEDAGISAPRIGKLIIATRERELPGLDELERRGRANGVEGLQRLDPDELREIEPHARGLAAVHSPNTGIVDFAEVARALARDVEAAAGFVVTACDVRAIERSDTEVRLVHAAGSLRAAQVVFCGGLAADRLALMDGADPDPRIVPFRGSYLRLRHRREELVRTLVYPVPDPRLPFLGVHLTRHPRGGVLVGPTALLELRMRSLTWPGTWRVMRRFWRAGATEVAHALSRRALVAAAARFVPELRASDVEPGWHGVRAQAVGRDGTLYDDFAFSSTARTLHVRNAPSPAATSSLAIAREVADRFERLDV
jgi:(S)-2-hydroxyglutarate dehydrogenase